MKYRSTSKLNLPLSVLGYGCMRFEMKGGRVDEDYASELIDTAIEAGVNYFDTAYIYQSGKNEMALGAALERNGKRKEVYIADKLPQYMIRNEKNFDTYFDTQLYRLKTDYIDFYLMHMLADLGTWERLKKMGIEKWLDDKRASGQIKYVGFSFHGGKDEFKKIIDAYEWDMCQIQYNYLDENNQAGKEGLLYAAERDIPVVIMEPLRGGSLVNQLPKKARDAFEAAPQKHSAAQWGLKWIWNHPGVTVVLSGMSTIEQLKENIEIADVAEPNMMSESELQLIEYVRDSINEGIKVPCTGCRYCMPCPSGVDIPACFAAYNENYALGGKTSLMRYMQTTGAFSNQPHFASKCISCGKCEQHCPQSIPIREKLKDVAREMEGVRFKVLTFATKFIIRSKHS